MAALGRPGFLIGAPGAGELLLVFAAVLLLFGPRRLPGIARKLGEILDNLRRAARDFQDDIMRIDADPGAATPPDGTEASDDDVAPAG